MKRNNLAFIVKEEPTSTALAKSVVESCEEVRGRDIAVIDVRKVFDLSDYFIVVSGRSDRQVQGITNKVIDELAAFGVEPISVEGFDDGQWVLIDFGDIVVHVFYEPVRDHVDIEGLWMRGTRVEMGSASAY